MGFKLHVVLYDTLENDFFFPASLFQKSNQPHVNNKQQIHYNSLPFFERVNPVLMGPIWCIKFSDA